jgi:hypothetical protein
MHSFKALVSLIAIVETTMSRCARMESGHVCILQREMLSRALNDAKTALAADELEARTHQLVAPDGNVDLR